MPEFCLPQLTCMDAQLGEVSNAVDMLMSKDDATDTITIEEEDLPTQVPTKYLSFHLWTFAPSVVSDPRVGT